MMNITLDHIIIVFIKNINIRKRYVIWKSFKNLKKRDKVLKYELKTL